MSCEDRFHRRLRNLLEQPGAGGLVDVVVVARLVGAVDVRRIVHEQEHAQVAGGVDPVLQPCALARLVGEPRIQQQGVHHDEAHPAVVECVEVGAERFAVGREKLVADPLGGHPVDRLVADVMVAGDEVQGHRELRRDRLEAFHRNRGLWQRRHRMHDVAEVHDEARRRVHGGDLGEHVTRPGGGEVVAHVRRGRDTLALVDVGVGDHDELEPRAAVRARRRSARS